MQSRGSGFPIGQKKCRLSHINRVSTTAENQRSVAMENELELVIGVQERALFMAENDVEFTPQVATRQIWPNIESIELFLQRNIAEIREPGKTYIVKRGTGSKTKFVVHSSDVIRERLQKFVFLYADGYGHDGRPMTNKYRGTDYLKSPNCTSFQSIVFDPSFAKAHKFNLFRGLAFSPAEQFVVDYVKVQPFVDHVRLVMANGEEEGGRWLLSWMAHLIQHPGKKPGSACVFRGSQGTGKTLCWEIFGMLIGSKLVSTVDSMHSVIGKFNSVIANKLLVVVDETCAGDDVVGSYKLKAMITSTKRVYEKKFIDAIFVKAFDRFVFLSNHDHPVRVETTDRRYACFDVSDTHLNNHAYFDHLSATYKDQDNLNHLFQFFHQYRARDDPIPSILRPLDSSMRQELQVHSRNTMNNFLLDMGNDSEYIEVLFAHKQFFTANELFVKFQLWCQVQGYSNRNHATLTALGMKLRHIGLVRCKRRGVYGYEWDADAVKQKIR